MTRFRRLSSGAHGMIDYVVGLGLILSPWLFGFAEVGGAAKNLPIFLGIVLLGSTLFTAHEWGLFKLLPLGYHLVLDLASGILLSLSPWVFDFAGEETKAWLPHVVIGLGLIFLYLISRLTPGAEVDPQTD